MNCKVKELLLGGNDITDVGCTAIADALESNTNLRLLVMGDNRISDAGAEQMAKSLKVNKTLKELSLSCTMFSHSPLAGPCAYRR